LTPFVRVVDWDIFKSVHASLVGCEEGLVASEFR
jgi:hypothetical protein